jgi:hypothetical protein
MEPLTFGYILMYSRGDLDEEPIRPDESPRNVAAVAMWTGPLLAVMWDHAKQIWKFNPAPVANMYAFPERYRAITVDRTTAEAETPRFATTALPDEATLTEICRQADRT